jgi:2-polyprenyl-3-methyl-5-hydroxy-6-metoxy-1,4-benzoquinol methylase
MVAALLAIVVGAFYPAYQSLQTLHPARSAWLVGIAFTLSALNFLHGKVRALGDEAYVRALLERQSLASLDFVLNAIICLTFLFQAIRLASALSLIAAVMLARAIDAALVYIANQKTESARRRRAQRTWLLIDFAIIALFAGVLGIESGAPRLYDYVAYTYLAAVVGDIIVDYSVNLRLYFGRWLDWGDFARHWDNRQGRNGDPYRQFVIIPSILALFGDDLVGKRVLDLGCGNGCLARALGERGANVVAIDKYRQMIKLAMAYEDQPNVEYEVFDVLQPPRLIGRGNFDYILAAFSLQDCGELSHPMRLIELNLAPAGFAVVVTENSYGVSPERRHFTTERHWMDGDAKDGVQRQLIVWTPTDEDGHQLATVTYHWEVEAYTGAAKQAGLEVVHSYDIEVADTPGLPPMIADYVKYPRFRSLSLRKKQVGPGHTVHLKESQILVDPSLPDPRSSEARVSGTADVP